jgi:hypothetical protein
MQRIREARAIRMARIVGQEISALTGSSVTTLDPFRWTQ